MMNWIVTLIIQLIESKVYKSRQAQTKEKHHETLLRSLLRVKILMLANLPMTFNSQSATLYSVSCI